MGRVKSKKAEAVDQLVPSTPTLRVIGCGGVGFWLVAGLARSGVRPIEVWDTDDLNGGLGHMRLPVASPATLKVNLLRGFLAVNFPGGRLGEITFKAERFTGKEVNAGDVVVDCTDLATKERKAIWATAKRRGARCIRVSYDGANSTIVVAEGCPLEADEENAPGGYADVPSLALSLAAGGVGAEVVRRMFEAAAPVDHIEFQITLTDYIGEVERAVATSRRR